ncbi:MAG: NAD(P)H-hydrate epimerase [Candidatus Omnitrophota bacterium]|nr:NAD(P)H-hydrate epimerase [Candidatus Omnitrophota bacterium]
MKSVTSQKMKRIDLIARKRFGIPAIVLMENAGRAAYEAAIGTIKGKNRQVICICGKGNNGGDGFVCARHLVNNGINTSIFLIGSPKDLTGEAKVNYNILKKMKEKVWLLSNKNLKLFKDNLAKTGLIVDAIFGTGLSGEIKNPYRKIIELINLSKKPVLSIDIPSGLSGDCGTPLPIAVKAVKTVTFALPKTGLISKQGPHYTGELIVANISIPKILL